MKEPQATERVTSLFGDFLVFVDESGDHGLENCDPRYPVFVLAFCILRKTDYAERICPSIVRFKLRHFGHDLVVLHEHEIVKSKGAFNILLNEVRRREFMTELTELIEHAPMEIVAVVIRKDRLRSRFSAPENPYHLALEHGLERVASRLTALGGGNGPTPVICEGRGRREDDALELEFRRVAERVSGLQIHFASKKANLPGLQLADLIARPIGRHVLSPQQLNRAYDVIQPKLWRGPRGEIDGYGLKVLP
ncbi:MAG: DUF3800 domain-containing protein [Planctomycetota bacterium]|nr:DUF3800 domain-containing protein [Planctomycetota bacterium]